MNNDLISREALKNEVQNICKTYTEMSANQLGYDILNLIDNAPTVDFEKLGKSLNCQIRATYGSCDDCELSCPRNELIKLLDSTRPQGKWITNQEYIDKEFNGHYEGSCFNSPYNCSCCGYSPEDNRPKFCPNCGARMVRGGETK